MSYKYIKDLTSINRTVKSSRQIKYIVIHYTGNGTDTAKANANYFRSVNRGASAHYFVDDEFVYQSVKDKDEAWSVGKNYGSNNLFNKVTNSNSISIEMCSKNSIITNETFYNTVELTISLMNKYNISSDNVYRHYDVCSKQCPGWSGWGTRANDTGTVWNKFKASIKANVNTNTYPHYRAHIQSIGWDTVQNVGGLAGTTGRALRMEAIKIDYPGVAIEAKAHIQSIGDVSYGVINSSTVIGTTGQKKRLEALYLKGPVQARVHVQSIGWMPWTDMSTGTWIGTKGKALRMEAIEIKRL